MKRMLIGLCALAAYAPYQAAAQMVQHDDGSITVNGSTFDSITDFHKSQEFRDGGHRCGTVMPPIALAGPSDCSYNSTTIDSAYNTAHGDTFEIPVVFHVITSSGGQGDVSDTLLRSQIDILNEDFRAIAGSPGGPGADAGIQFILATIDPDGNPTTGIERVANDSWFNDSGSFKSSLGWDTDRYLNLYTNNTSALGYATLPATSAGSNEDGVVLTYRSVGRDAPAGGDYDQGRTGTHEIGHYLGLFHTFQDGDCNNSYSGGDRITDTEAESEPRWDCNGGYSSCGSSDPIHNYMDYTNDTCMFEFTVEQVNRMRCSITHYRPELTTWLESNARPVAAFSVGGSGFNVTFTDQSTDSDGTIVSWSWNFGDGATSTEQSPAQTYTTEGKFTVSLTVTDDGDATGTASKEIVLNTPPKADFQWDASDLTVNFTDLSTDPSSNPVGQLVSWSWDFGDGGSSTEQSPSHPFAAEGTYSVSLTVTDDLGGTNTATYDVEADENGGSGGGGNTDSGGCGCRTTTGASGSWLLLAVVGLALVGRRRRPRG